MWRPECAPPGSCVESYGVLKLPISISFASSPLQVPRLSAVIIDRPDNGQDLRLCPHSRRELLRIPPKTHCTGGSLCFSQRDHWVHLGCAPRWKIAGQNGNCKQKQ